MNETNRELLELAAKAAGYAVLGIIHGYADGATHWWKGAAWGLQIEDVDGIWNPITDDGDAFRLAVKLLFEIDMGRGSVAVRHSSGIKVLEAFNLDPYAATRLAIVRAAAEIGRTMK